MNKGTKRNQCDGCQAGVPLENGKHRMGRPGGYPDLMSCTAHLYGRRKYSLWHGPFSTAPGSRTTRLIQTERSNGLRMART